jgi:hypothetical protein
LTVLALRRRTGALTAREALRELLHDATEGLVGFDALLPLKKHLGPHFKALDHRLQQAVDRRYFLPEWTEDAYAAHKSADRVAAACEAFHVVGWSRDEMVGVLGIDLEPLAEDPLPPPENKEPWEPWPPKLAAKLFLQQLELLLEETRDRQTVLDDHFRSFKSLPPNVRAQLKWPPTGDPNKDILVLAESDDSSQSVSGIVVDGEIDGDEVILDDFFTIFFIGDDHKGHFLECNGANCHVEIL